MSFLNLGVKIRKSGDLLAPSSLAKQLNKKDTTDLPIIYNIGPAGRIKNAVDIGATHDENNIEKLKEQLSKLPTNSKVVIYCGCCPFEKCPNIRPAFKLLQEMHFKNAQLLDLPQNLKTDWIDKGYPVED